MKEIPLTQDLVALVDDEDYEVLSKYKWFAQRDRNTYYAHTVMYFGDSKVIVRMHWFITGTPLSGFISDHRDGRGYNNKRDNTRIIYEYQNHQNFKNFISRQKRLDSAYPGVCKSLSKWRAHVMVNADNVYLGTFTTEFEAFYAYRYALLLSNRYLLPEWEDTYQKNLPLNIETHDIEKMVISTIKRIRQLEEERLIKTQEAVRKWGLKYIIKGAAQCS